MSHPEPERRTNAPPGPERLLAGLTPEQAQAVTNRHRQLGRVRDEAVIVNRPIRRPMLVTRATARELAHRFGYEEILS